MKYNTAIGVAVLLPFLGVSSLNLGPLTTAAFFLANRSKTQLRSKQVSRKGYCFRTEVLNLTLVLLRSERGLAQQPQRTLSPVTHGYTFV